MNRIELIGNLGRDPEMSYTQNGTAVTRFSLATTYRHKNESGETLYDTTWHNIVAFGPQAEAINTYAAKGKKMYVAGRLQKRDYSDRDGVKRTAVDVVLADFEFLSPKEPVAETSKENDDEVPF